MSLLLRWQTKEIYATGTKYEYPTKYFNNAADGKSTNANAREYGPSRTLLRSKQNGE